MQYRRCSKKYPRSLVAEIITGENGYLLYHRHTPQQERAYGGYKFSMRAANFGQQIDCAFFFSIAKSVQRSYRSKIVR